MKRSALGIAALALVATAFADVPRISRFALARLEAQIDRAFASEPTPFDIIGDTRGVYLAGYGAVFTTMISLAPTPIPNPFHELTLKDTLQIHERKLHQLPVLRDRMRETLLGLAESPALDSVHLNEQIVCGATMFYFKWEDTTGLPSQIVMQAEKGKLLDVKSGRIPRSQLDSVIKTQEL
jgi:hypothetical protein